MDLERARRLAMDLGSMYSEEERLSGHLSLGIGGTPAFYLRPSSWQEAERALLGLWESDLPIRVLGGGSNLLADDGALPFGVVHLARLAGGMRWEGNRLEADADVPVPALVAESVRRGLAGLEGMGGVPGALGGAIVMNAGAFGNEVAGVLREVALIETGAGLRWHPVSEFAFAYRGSNVKAAGVVAACRMEFRPSEAEVLRARFDQAKAHRQATQPWRAATAGSVFKNPPGEPAGRLLERLGFKGARRGGAGFSDLHANFLVNHGGATFADAFGLCEEARGVAARAGVPLDYEMEIWR